MDINQQAALCEELLRLETNKFCADCPSKIPRWASINFGVFICIRCSGVHRQLGTHISKVKSVNLDKWPPGKIELFKNVSNDMINSYWEKNLPKGYRKPDANASNKEVTDFLEDKYVRKKWANTEDWANDPAWLYENKTKKFQKYVSYYVENFQGGKQIEDKSKPSKNDDSSDDDEWVKSKPKPQKQQPKKLELKQPTKQAAKAPAQDLLSFDTTPQQPQKKEGNGNIMDMLGGSGGNDGGFGDFQGSNNNVQAQPVNMQSGTNPTNMTQQTINIQNLYQMYNANAHSANDKYSALDSMVTGNSMQQPQNSMMGGFGQAQPQQQQKQPFQPMVGQMQNFGMGNNNQMGGQAGFGGMQQPQMNSMQAPGAMSGFNQGGAFGAQPQQQQQQQKAAFQPNAFGSMNVGMGQQPMGGGVSSNPMSGFQQTQVPSYSNQQQPQQPTFGGFGGAPQQQQQPTSGSFGSFQSAPQQTNNVFAGGLVDLSNLGGGTSQSSAGSSGMVFGQSPGLNMGSGFGGGMNQMGSGGSKPSGPTWDNQGQNQQKSNAFNGLVKF